MRRYAFNSQTLGENPNWRAIQERIFFFSKTESSPSAIHKYDFLRFVHKVGKVDGRQIIK